MKKLVAINILLLVLFISMVYFFETNPNFARYLNGAIFYIIGSFWILSGVIAYFISELVFSDDNANIFAYIMGGFIGLYVILISTFYKSKCPVCKRLIDIHTKICPHCKNKITTCPTCHQQTHLPPFDE